MIVHALYISIDIVSLFSSGNCAQALLKLFQVLGTHVPYFFGYKTRVFSFQNNSKDLDPSCKTDLDLWDCLGRVNLVL